MRVKDLGNVTMNPCKYNDSVDCEKHDCHKCGWCPAVSMCRRRRIRDGELTEIENGGNVQRYLRLTGGK